MKIEKGLELVYVGLGSDKRDYTVEVIRNDLISGDNWLILSNTITKNRIMIRESFVGRSFRVKTRSTVMETE